MEKKQQQPEEHRNEKKLEDQKNTLEGLPLETSPYVQYKDIEDYKRQGYGAEGHLQPKPGRAAGSTDAPTVTGGSVSSEAELSAADNINRRGAP